MTSKGPSPLLGYNTNVRHKGVLCHVQTEDSGVGHPHVITHLFTAGTIVATKRRSYAEHVGSTDIELVVRKLMQEQHKQMCIELRDGAFDEALQVKDTQETKLGPAEASPTPPDQPPPMEPPPAPRARPPLPRLPEDVPSELHLAREDGTPPPPSAVRVKAPPPAPTTYAVVTPAPPVRRRGPTPPPQVRGATPSPPARGETPSPAARGAPSPRGPTPPPQRGPTPPPLVRGGEAPTPSPTAGRYSSRAPGLFGGGRAPTPRPPEEASIFGQEHISEKSLDEVILAYLSEEVEE